METPTPLHRLIRRVRLSYVAAVASGLAVVLVAYLIVRPGATDGDADPTVTYGSCGSPPISVSIAVSPDKQHVMARLAATYNSSRRLFDGRCAKIDVFAEPSGDLAAALESPWNPDEHLGHPAPAVISPASSEWLRLQARRDLPLEVVNTDRGGRLPSLAKSPLVLAMPQPMAASLGGRISWNDLIRMSGDPQWWASRGHPEWGPVKLGKTNPDYSTSGLLATLATYVASTTAHGLPLTETAVDDPAVRADLAGVERSVVHYGETSLAFLTNLALADQRGRAMNYVSAVAVEEKSVHDYNQGRPDGDTTQSQAFHPKVPLVPLYPSDGTFVSDHPYAVLSTASAPQRLAAHDFLRYLLEPDQQKEFREAGFRSADGRLDPALAAASGLRSDTRITALPEAAPKVLARVQDSWKSLRKPARVLIALDVSASMGADPFDKSATPKPGRTKLDLAKTAAKHSLDLFQPQDRVGLWSFSGDRRTGDDAHTEEVPLGPFAPKVLRTRIDALRPELSTALYTTIRDAYDVLDTGSGPGTVTALVVLTDGRNEWERDDDLDALRRHVDATGDDHPVRVFTIAYGHEADEETLTAIAGVTGGWSYDATDPRSLDKVLREVFSNF